MWVYFSNDQEHFGFTITTRKVQTWQFAFLSVHMMCSEGLFIFYRKINSTVKLFIPLFHSLII